MSIFIDGMGRLAPDEQREVLESLEREAIYLRKWLGISPDDIINIDFLPNVIKKINEDSQYFYIDHTFPNPSFYCVKFNPQEEKMGIFYDAKSSYQKIFRFIICSIGYVRSFDDEKASKFIKDNCMILNPGQILKDVIASNFADAFFMPKKLFMNELRKYTDSEGNVNLNKLSKKFNYDDGYVLRRGRMLNLMK